MRPCITFIEMIRLFTLLLLLIILILVLQANSEMKRGTSASTGHSREIPDLKLSVQSRKNEFISENTNPLLPLYGESGPQFLVRSKRRMFQSNRRPGGFGDRRSKLKEKITPEAKLDKLTKSIFKRVSSYRIPNGWVLPYCFKDTHLKEDIEKTSEICERMGIDWACVFAELAGGDNGFSITVLEQKFEEVTDKKLRRGLSSAIVSCKEYWEKYKSEERRRLLLHELEAEVMDKTWKEHGKVIGERRKRGAGEGKKVGDPAVLRKALLEAGLADLSSTANAATEDEAHGEEKSQSGLEGQGSIVEHEPTKTFSKVNGEVNRPIRDSSGGCLKSAHPWKKRSRRENICGDTPFIRGNDEITPQNGLIEDPSGIRLEFLCSADDLRCRRQNTFNYDRIKAERTRKREEVARRKNEHEKAQKRIQELMTRVGGGGAELQAILATSTAAPAIESKLGLHLMREERIEMDLRFQVSTCISEEAARACEMKVMKAISLLLS